MNLEEIQSIQLSPLIDKPFSLLWSGDDKISVNMERGLLVLEFVPDINSNQKGFCFNRSWITPSDEMPTHDVGIKVDDFFSNLGQEELHHLIGDTYLAPKLATTSPNPAYIAQAAWSPQGMIQHGKCLLSTLTNYGCALVQAPRGRKWYTVANISHHWKQHCRTSWTTIKTSKANKQFYELQDRVARVRITCVAWSDLFKNESLEMGYFITGVQNGDIVIWRLNVVQNDVDIQLEPELVLEFDSGLEQITAMLWKTVSPNKAYLWVGDTQGCIRMFTLGINGPEISTDSCRDLWTEKERLSVCRFLLLNLTAFSIMLLAIKETFLFVFHISENVIDVKSELIGNFAIYGIEKFDDETVLLASYSASVKKIKLLKNENELVIKCDTMIHDKTSDYGYYGLAASKNKVLWVLSASVCKPYDHLILREPAQVLFFTFPQCADPYSLLINNPMQSLTNHWDCLELVRIRGTAKSYLNVDSNKLDVSNLYQLRLMFWLTKFALLNENTEEKYSELQKQVQEIYNYILCRHMCKLTQKLSLRRSRLSEIEQQSLAFMYQWLHKSSTNASFGEKTKIVVRLILHTIKPQSLTDEECPVCKTKCVEQDNAIEMQCPAGHTMPRCNISFVPCSDQPYWLCRFCLSLACKNVGVVQEPKCIYCDSFMCLDDRLLSFQS